MKKWKKFTLSSIVSVGLVGGFMVGNQHCWKTLPYTKSLGSYDVNNDGTDDLVISVPAPQLSYSSIGWINGNGLSSRRAKGSNGFELNSNINYFDRMIKVDLIPNYPADVGRRGGVAGQGIYVRIEDGSDFFLAR